MKTRILTSSFFISCFLILGLSSQAETSTIENPIEHFAQGENKKAQFPGGSAAYSNWLVENFYQPQGAKRYGTVIVEFVVKKNGKCSDFAVAKSIDEELDNAAIAILEYMPDWEPAMQAGKAVESKVRLPVRFINQAAE